VSLKEGLYLQQVTKWYKGHSGHAGSVLHFRSQFDVGSDMTFVENVK
jgi:hypothetical protein